MLIVTEPHLCARIIPTTTPAAKPEDSFVPYMDVAIAAASSTTGLTGKLPVEDANFRNNSPTPSDSDPHRVWLRQQTGGATTSTTTITSGGGRYSRDAASNEMYIEISGDICSPPQEARSALSSTAHSSGGASYYQATIDCESGPAESGVNDSLERQSARYTYEQPIVPEPPRKMSIDPLPDSAASNPTNGEGPFPGATATKATNDGYLALPDVSSSSEPIPPGPKFRPHYDVPDFTASSRSAPTPSHQWPILAESTRLMNFPDIPTHSAASETNDIQAVATELPTISADVLDSEKLPAFT
ncbi:hypothetical protein HYPSUDRAFT_210224, partial [Hypholoma sublateritium FD-334 SS-4]